MIEKINSKQAFEILEKKEPRGLFYYKMGQVYLGIDNSKGYAWTKRFKKLKLCKKWLIGGSYERSN